MLRRGTIAMFVITGAAAWAAWNVARRPRTESAAIFRGFMSALSRISVRDLLWRPVALLDLRLPMVEVSPQLSAFKQCLAMLQRDFPLAVGYGSNANSAGKPFGDFFQSVSSWIGFGSEYLLWFQSESVFIVVKMAHDLFSLSDSRFLPSIKRDRCFAREAATPLLYGARRLMDQELSGWRV
jgi:hypothetical protein